MSALKTNKQNQILTFIRQNFLSIYVVFSVLFIICTLFIYLKSFVYALGYGDAIRYAESQVDSIEKVGYTNAVADIFQEAQDCNPFTVTYQNQQVQLIKSSCVAQ